MLFVVMTFEAEESLELACTDIVEEEDSTSATDSSTRSVGIKANRAVKYSNTMLLYDIGNTRKTEVSED